MGRIVNQREMADILDVSAKSVSLWQREGLPIALETENGLENQYDTGAVIRWWVAREVAKAPRTTTEDGESQRDRLARVQADKIELEIAKERRQLIPAEEIEPAWIEMVAAAREALLTVPPRIAPLLAQMDGMDAMRDLLEEQIEEVLQKLASDGDRVTDQAAGEGATEVGPAVADVAGGVG